MRRGPLVLVAAAAAVSCGDDAPRPAPEPPRAAPTQIAPRKASAMEVVRASSGAVARLGPGDAAESRRLRTGLMDVLPEGPLKVDTWERFERLMQVQAELGPISAEPPKPGDRPVLSAPLYDPPKWQEADPVADALMTDGFDQANKNMWRAMARDARRSFEEELRAYKSRYKDDLAAAKKQHAGLLAEWEAAQKRWQDWSSPPRAKQRRALADTFDKEKHELAAALDAVLEGALAPVSDHPELATARDAGRLLADDPLKAGDVRQRVLAALPSGSFKQRVISELDVFEKTAGQIHKQKEEDANPPTDPGEKPEYRPPEKPGGSEAGAAMREMAMANASPAERALLRAAYADTLKQYREDVAAAQQLYQEDLKEWSARKRRWETWSGSRPAREREQQRLEREMARSGARLSSLLRSWDGDADIKPSPVRGKK